VDDAAGSRGHLPEDKDGRPRARQLRRSAQRFLVGGERGAGRASHPNRSAALTRPASPSRRRSASSASRRSSALRNASVSPGGTSRPVSPSTTRSRRPPTALANHGTAVGHRLGAHDAVALPVGRARHDGGALVEAQELPVRHEAERAGDASRSGPSPRRPAGGRAPPRRARGCPSRPRAAPRRGHAAARPAPRPPRESRRARDHAHLAGAERAGVGGERVRRGDHEPRATEDRPSEPRRAARELDVVPHTWTTYGLPSVAATAPAPSQCACTRSASRAARAAARRNARSIAAGAQPAPGANAGSRPLRSVRKTEVAERARRHDVDVHAARTKVTHGVGDEEPRHVLLVPRVGRREDGDLQPGLTTGSSSCRPGGPARARAPAAAAGRRGRA